MKKRNQVFAAVLGTAGLALAGAAGSSGVAHAAACPGVDDSANPSNTTVAPLPDGGSVYTSGSGSTSSGYIGVSGPHGFLEVGGDSNSGTVSASGSSTDAPASGQVSSSGMISSVCVNGLSGP